MFGYVAQSTMLLGFTMINAMGTANCFLMSRRRVLLLTGTTNGIIGLSAMSWMDVDKWLTAATLAIASSAAAAQFGLHWSRIAVTHPPQATSALMWSGACGLIAVDQWWDVWKLRGL